MEGFARAQALRYGAPDGDIGPAFVHRLYALFAINNGMTRLTVETAIVALEDRGGGQEQVGEPQRETLAGVFGEYRRAFQETVAAVPETGGLDSSKPAALLFVEAARIIAPPV